MEWYSNLYVGETAQKKKRKIIRKIKTNTGMIGVYLITFSANGQNLLEIISTAYLQQTAVRRNLPPIVGIACGYDEALDLVVKIIEETYGHTGDFAVRKYLTQKECERRQE